MLKQLLCLVFFASWCAQGQTITAQKVNQTGRGRYVAADDFRFEQIDFPQPDYKFESALPEGFGRATAAELGVVGQHFWNEYPGQGAALVTMNPDTVLIYDTVNRQALYVLGCYREGKPGMNRIKGMNRIRATFVPPPPAPCPEPASKPVVEELTFTPEEGAVQLASMPPPPDRPVAPEPVEFQPDKGRKFPIPCWPREKGWFGTGLPIAECAAIGVLTWGLWPAAAVGTKVVPVGGVISPF